MYDVIVVGGGHSGIEAAYASSKMKAKTLLLTQSVDSICEMPCNPSVGGGGKSQLVKEIDAMGGLIGRNTDSSGIQFKKLHYVQGPATQSTRIQVDKFYYKIFMKNFVIKLPNLTIIKSTVNDFIEKKNKILGIITKTGMRVYGKTVIFTIGTFLRGKIFIGSKCYNGGKIGESITTKLSYRFYNLGFKIFRFKTGTPPRLNFSNIDIVKLKKQSSDVPIPFFSIWKEYKYILPNKKCFLTYTNNNTYEIITNNLEKSAIYSGYMQGLGPRYCPSIEDKFVKFSNKKNHQIFLEPEGLQSMDIYPNGLSTSLPIDIQILFIKSIEGLQNTNILQPGYSVEYDYFDPRYLKLTMETQIIKNLFFAGQINGTTGYEEAAAQGLIAGINAAKKSFNQKPWIPNDSDSYLGILIKDLVTKGVSEPYRMSANYSSIKLNLREDNVYLRLTNKAKSLNLLTDNMWKKYIKYEKDLFWINQSFYNQKEIYCDTFKFAKFNQLNNNVGKNKLYIIDLLKKFNTSFKILVFLLWTNRLTKIQNKSIYNYVGKYNGCKSKHYAKIKQILDHNNLIIGDISNYKNIKGLSSEACEKLNNYKPKTLKQASKIPGITPSIIHSILIFKLYFLG